MGPSEERFVNALLQPLWDLRLTVGQHVRELTDFADRRRSTSATPNSSSRCSTFASSPATSGSSSGIDGWVRGLSARQPSAAARSAAARSSTSATRASTTRSISSSPTSRGARRAARHRRDTSYPARSGPAAPKASSSAPSRQLQDAEDFCSARPLGPAPRGGRDVNVLTHELQERVAECSAARARQSQQRVEALMGEYFRHARASSRGARPRPAGARRRRAGMTRVAARRPAFRDHRRRRALPRSRRAPRRSRRCGSSSSGSRCRDGCPVSEQALTCIEQNVDRYTADDFVATEGDRLQLARAARPARRASTPGCRRCTTAGCWIASSRSSRGFTAASIRDFYHKYTVDEHTLLTIRNLESLREPDDPGQQRFDSILQELHAPELLTLALLFHDVGKWRDADHAQESVRLAQSDARSARAADRRARRRSSS